MPSYNISLPPSAYNFVSGESTFSLTGSGGRAVEVFSLFAGDSFSGETLEGQWLKSGNDVINPGVEGKIYVSAGRLRMSGASRVAGSDGAGFIFSKNKIWLYDDVDFNVELRDRVGAPGSPVALMFSFMQNSGISIESEDNRLTYGIEVRGSANKYFIIKEVAGSTTNLWVPAEAYTQPSTVKFRTVFQERKIGSYHSHLYYKTGTNWVEIPNSPTGLNLDFESAYPLFEYKTADATNREASSSGVNVTYPDFKVKYDLEDVYA